MKRILGALVCALLLLPAVTACGNGDEDKAKKSLSTLMRGEKGSVSMSEKEAECTAGKLVDGVGVERLQKYDILTKDLKANKDPSDNVKMTKKDADAAATAIVECIDLVKAVTSSAGSKFTPKQKECLAKELTKDSMHTMWSAYFQGKNDEASKALITPVLKCAKL